MRTLTTLLVLALVPLTAPGAECSARSGPNAVALVELYTSEGCESCPPADRWITSIAAAGYGTSSVVPIVLHVDYWDHIGWKDPFGNPEFGERQRRFMRISGARFVYTPQVTFNGRDYGGWRSASDFRQAVTAANAKSAGADLDLHASVSGREYDIHVGATLRGRQAPAHHTVTLAVTENRLESKVKAGENRGATLRHDHVVREWRPLGPIPGAGRLESRIRFEIPPAWKVQDLAIVAFVQNHATGEVLQALSLPACRG